MFRVLIRTSNNIGIRHFKTENAILTEFSNFRQQKPSTKPPPRVYLFGDDGYQLWLNMDDDFSECYQTNAILTLLVVV